jgi:ribonuclease E
MKKEMLINVLQPEECRIAIVEDGVLEELYVERASQESYVNNIYKGRIVNIEPSIQAAFVDFGIGRNGFLHVSDVDPVYYKHLDDRGGDRRGRGRGDRDRGDRRDSGRGRRPFEPVIIPAGDVDALPPEFQEPEPAQQLTGWLEPAAPILDGPVDESESTFGAGLELDEARESHVAGNGDPAPFEEDAGLDSEENQTPARMTSLSEVVDALPGNGDPTAAAEEGPTESPRRKTTAKGRGRRGKSDNEDSAEPRGRRRSKRKNGNDDSTSPEATPPDAINGKDSDDPKPRFMNSAERRTVEDEPEIDSTPFGGDIVFDPFAPNDRFNESTAARTPVRDDSTFSDEAESDDAEAAGVMEESAATFVEENPAADAVMYSEDVEDVEETQVEVDDEEDDLDLDEEFPGMRGRGRRDRDRGDRGDRGGRGRGPRRSFGRDSGRIKPPIQEIFKRGQEVIVQVIKEGIGTKGPTLSTYISIAGRYLVLMPSLNRLAVSRKIIDENIRIRLKESLSQLNPPKGIGFIIRTAAIDRNKAELRNDLSYLVRLWEVFTSRVLKRPAPVEIYRESDMITRTIRDIFTSDIDSIWVDEQNAYTQASEFLKIVMPRYADRIKHYADTEPLFHRHKIEQEIARINEKKIPLAMGGSIVIEQTEALVAIDVNSGNFRADNNAEETAYQMNLQAAKEIGRQLRLRDLGGVIVNDFIDMKHENHRRAVEQALRNALRRDRARTKILKTSAFGVIEMTRQRIRPSLKRSIYQDCPHCRATGNVKTAESMSIEIMRMLQLAAHRKTVRTLNIGCQVDVAQHLLNKKRKEILQWEEIGQMQVTIAGALGVSPEKLEVQGFDNNGNEVRITPVEPQVRPAPERRNDDERDRRGNRDRDRDDRDERGGRGNRDDRGGRSGRDDRGGRGGRGGGRGRGGRGRDH